MPGLPAFREVAGAIGQLQPAISPGYGFTAIIVAFLGRLNPLGIVVAGLVLALTYLGGEAAQMSLGVSDKAVRAFQGMLLFFVLACDTLILYRIRIVTWSRQGERSCRMGMLEAILLTIMTASTPLLIAAVGELVVERSGVLNLGVEGMMVMGAVSGFGVALSTGSPWLGVFAGDRRRRAVFAAVRLPDADAGRQPGGDRPGADAARARPFRHARRRLRRPAGRPARAICRSPVCPTCRWSAG